MKILTRLFTKNLTKIPLIWITFNWKLFKENGANGGEQFSNPGNVRRRKQNGRKIRGGECL